MSRTLALLLLLLALPALAQERLTVFAAASLKNALDEANAGSPVPVVVSYGASSTLVRQIEAGAPAQGFISADEDWMDELEKRNLLAPGTRRNLLGNRLVWIAPAGRSASAEPWRALGPRDRVAMGDPRHVPAGKYARAALEKLGLWDQLAGRVAGAENVRAALALVARGESPLGIVYETDARDEPKVAIVAHIDPRLHPPIVYPAAALRGASSDALRAARRYLDYLASPFAMWVFARHGFTRP
ncbi:MAG TPA: molybdate ABC transporter substrate-binding protein [Burkholderiales bacterium]|nr:molybdate ABC transporter substrate-binding protein [Burkholderiales bacterium]